MASPKQFRARLWLWILLLVIFASTAAKVGPTALAPQKFSDFTTPIPIPEGDTLVIGFLGGWEKWDEPKRGVRKFALRLRAKNLPGVHIETVENHRREIALELVEKAFDRDGWFYPPTKPGLGIEVSDEVVDRYRSEKVLGA